jgi:Lon protease-like protein
VSRGPFDPGFEDLPVLLPIFPLTGVLLLPRGRLPLNIFEPRYLAMTRHALGPGQMIGMVQPQEGHGDAGDPPVYRIGCAGRIVEFAETPDGRYLITLLGVARFDIGAEPSRQELFRIVRPDWQRFRADLAEYDPALDRSRLIDALKPYFKRHGIKADVEALAATPIERLVNSLAMGCPFLPREKQALLEAHDTAERAEVLTALVEMAVLGTDDAADGVRRH